MGASPLRRGRAPAPHFLYFISLEKAVFTTKPVGKGAGLGLAIAHQIIVEKHNGTLSVNSQTEQGAEFAIELPVIELPQC